MAMDRVSYEHVQYHTLAWLKEKALFVASVPPGGTRKKSLVHTVLCLIMTTFHCFCISLSCHVTSQAFVPYLDSS